MIVRDKPGILQLMFSMRGSVLPHILRPLAVLVAVSAVMVLIDRSLFKLPESNVAPVSYTHLDVYKRQIQRPSGGVR